MARKNARRERMKLADPVTYAAVEAAQRAGEERYGLALKETEAEMRAVLAGRDPRRLKGEDAIKFMTALTRFNEVSFEHVRFMEADLERRLEGDGGELVPA